MKFIRNVLFVISFLLLPFAAQAEPLDINSADAAALAAAIDGVGEVKAQAIVAYRNEYGSFKSVDDLVLVKGIGVKTVEKNRDKLTVGSAPTTEAASQ